MYVMCKDHNCLPFRGGMAEQPATLVEKWNIIDRSVSALKELNKELE